MYQGTMIKSHSVSLDSQAFS